MSALSCRDHIDRCKSVSKFQRFLFNRRDTPSLRRRWKSRLCACSEGTSRLGRMNQIVISGEKEENISTSLLVNLESSTNAQMGKYLQRVLYFIIVLNSINVNARGPGSRYRGNSRKYPVKNTYNLKCIGIEWFIRAKTIEKCKKNINCVKI